MKLLKQINLTLYIVALLMVVSATVQGQSIPPVLAIGGWLNCVVFGVVAVLEKEGE